MEPPSDLEGKATIDSTAQSPLGDGSPGGALPLGMGEREGLRN